jgi:hypothetical protein
MEIASNAARRRPLVGVVNNFTVLLVVVDDMTQCLPNFQTERSGPYRAAAMETAARRRGKPPPSARAEFPNDSWGKCGAISSRAKQTPRFGLLFAQVAAQKL